MTARIVAVIPARLGSSRFPGKPLAPILGLPMIEHVYRRTAECVQLQEVVVATCDEAIRQVVEGFGGRAIMTAASHERASDRVAEAAEKLDADIIVMVQGDEPLIRSEMITESLGPLVDPAVQCVNLMAPIESEDELRDPNTIKVVRALNGDALFFSREPIPTVRLRAFERGLFWKQVCVVPFRRPALRQFATLPSTEMEVAESIDMLRFLEHGVPVRMQPTRFSSHAVDTPEDLARVESIMANFPTLPGNQT